jgi:hypothetical protein
MQLKGSIYYFVLIQLFSLSLFAQEFPLRQRTQEVVRSALALGAVAANDEVNATQEQGLHLPGSRVTSVKDQHVAAAQALELIKEHLALALGLGADGHMQHQFIARQV